MHLYVVDKLLPRLRNSIQAEVNAGSTFFELVKIWFSYDGTFWFFNRLYRYVYRFKLKKGWAYPNPNDQAWMESIFGRSLNNLPTCLGGQQRGGDCRCSGALTGVGMTWHLVVAG